MTRLRRSARALVLVCAWPAILAGQAAPPPPGPPVPPAHPAALASAAGAPEAAPDRGGLAPRLAVAGAGVLATFAFDEPIRAWIQSDPVQRSAVLEGAADVLTPLGGPVPFAAVAALYGVGYLTGSPDLTDTGLHVGAGIVATGVVAGGIKVLVGRLRPYVPPHDAGAFFRGSIFAIDSERWSFPSGHTSLAFAFAGALTEEVGIHWPARKGVVAPVAYGLAAGVAFARVYTDRHWTSDVVAGAIVGSLVGPAVVRWTHARSARGDTAAVRFSILPGRDPGVAVRIPLP